MWIASGRRLPIAVRDGPRHTITPAPRWWIQREGTAARAIAKWPRLGIRITRWKFARSGGRNSDSRASSDRVWDRSNPDGPRSRDTVRSREADSPRAVRDEPARVRETPRESPRETPRDTPRESSRSRDSVPSGDGNRFKRPAALIRRARGLPIVAAAAGLLREQFTAAGAAMADAQQRWRGGGGWQRQLAWVRRRWGREQQWRRGGHPRPALRRAAAADKRFEKYHSPACGDSFAQFFLPMQREWCTSLTGELLARYRN